MARIYIIHNNYINFCVVESVAVVRAYDHTLYTLTYRLKVFNMLLLIWALTLTATVVIGNGNAETETAEEHEARVQREGVSNW